MRPKLTIGLITFLSFFSLCIATQAQRPVHRPWSANVIVPQTYRSSVSSRYQVQVQEVRADIAIFEQVATTRLDISLKNVSSGDQMAELLIPVPDGAAIKSFTFQGKAEEQTTQLLTRDEARSTFDSIVARLRDPALLEFAGYNLVRSSVFPVPAKGNQKVRIVYEHLLTAEGDRVDYVLPRSENVSYDVPWRINARIKSERLITTVYSPTHKLQTSPVGKKIVTTGVPSSVNKTPGPFRMSYLLKNGAMTASMFNYPNANGKGGYFMLLGGLGDANEQTEKIKREVTLVIDRSGSMRDGKIEQAREAALQVVEGLEMGETFNVIAYSDEVVPFSESAVVKSEETLVKVREFIKSIHPRGGTNLHDAVSRSLQSEPKKDVLPIVLFLTDGLPTIGNTSEVAIRKLATEANPHNKRIFSFGVGFDVNTPLLDRIATSTRGFATFVSPEEDVEVKVARVFKGLDGPIIAEPQVKIYNATGKPKPNRVSHMLPRQIPDLYEGDQLVLLGKYKGKKPLFVEMTGLHAGKERKFKFKFDLKPSLGTGNSFVARLWATRRIAELTDAIRDFGADNTAMVSTNASLDPRLKELTEEIVTLSREFGILTEYTSFFAEEGIDLNDHRAVSQRALQTYYDRAIKTRSGKASFNQERNNKASRGASCVNWDNRFWTADMKLATITNVQQCNLGAYYRKGNRWISNRLIDENKEEEETPDRTIEFGSKEFNELLWQFVKEKRNNELALDGDILLDVGGESVLIKGVKN